jgi:site-specific recombinase XerC
MTSLAPLLQAFFTDRLMTQYGASPHTIASYRDTFRLLLAHVHQQTGTLPARLDLADLDAATIGAFLHDLETVRGNSPATRNTRLAAIHSLFRYASLRAPELLRGALVEDVGVVDGEDVRGVESPAGRVPGGALVTVVMWWSSF